MDHDLCPALAANDRGALQKIVDDFLARSPRSDDGEQDLERIRAWLADHDCTSSVETSPDLVDIEPPVKEFVVNLTGGARPVTIGISLGKDRWRFQKK